jgi:hypothetical protein
VTVEHSLASTKAVLSLFTFRNPGQKPEVILSEGCAE